MKNKNGITLIALIITILVMVILAAVSMSVLFGEDGIIARAEKAKQEQALAREKERVELAVSEALITGLGKVQRENLKNALNKEFGPVDEAWRFESVEENEPPFLVRIMESGNNYKIEQDGKKKIIGRVITKYAANYYELYNKLTEFEIQELESGKSKLQVIVTSDDFTNGEVSLTGELKNKMDEYYRLDSEFDWEKYDTLYGELYNYEEGSEEYNNILEEISLMDKQLEDMDLIYNEVYAELNKAKLYNKYINYVTFAGNERKEIINYEFYNCKNIESIIIPNSVESIGNNAFYNCKALKEIIIPNSVESIGNNAFYNCKALKEIIIPKSVTSVGKLAFGECSALESVTLLGNIGTLVDDNKNNSIFKNCTSLKNILLAEGITKVKLSNFSSLKKIIIPGSVTSIYFNNCSSLEDIEFLTRETIIEISYSNFSSTTNLKKIKTNGNVSIGNFKNFQKLSSIELTGDGNQFNESGITSYRATFSGCTSLSSITIPESVTSIGTSVFSGCTSLSNITIPESVTSIGTSAFSGCTSLNNITIPNSVASIGTSAFSGCTSLSNITIPESLTSIGKSAFSGCTSLNNITIPNTVTSIGESTFSGCTSLSDITIPNSVTSIGKSAFSGCIELTNITIPESVTSIGISAFEGCRNLSDIILPSNLTWIGENAVYNCDSLKELKIPNQVTISMTKKIGLSGCDSLKTLYLPYTKDEIRSNIIINLPNGSNVLSPFYPMNCSVYCLENGEYVRF